MRRGGLRHDRVSLVLGERIAIGRTSEVFAYGNDSIAKVLAPGVPDHWAEVEAMFTRSVRELGVPAPEVRGLTVVDGRRAVIFERIFGPSMWELMLDAPADVEALTREFAEIQRAIQRAGVPDGVPDLVERMSSKIASVDALTAVERDEAIGLLESLPRGAALLHGDLHPGNVLVSKNTMVVIDWFDSVVGHPVADVMRSSLLMTSRGATDLRHLEGADEDGLDVIHEVYLGEMSDVLDPVGDAINDWRAVIAASRLAECTDLDTSGLHELWNARGTRADDAG